MEQELEMTVEEQQAKKTYYKMFLRVKKGTNEMCIGEIPKVIGTGDEENSFKPFPFLGIRKDDGEVEEFFTGKTIKSMPWMGLMYTMLVPISAKEMLTMVKRLTIEEQFRIIDRVEALEAKALSECGFRK